VEAVGCSDDGRPRGYAVSRTSRSAHRSTAKSAHPCRRCKPIHAHIQCRSSTIRRTPQRPPAHELAITLEPVPPALPSTRNRPRRAVRRGAARPTEQPSGCLVVREQKHGWASQHAVARRAGPGGPTPAVLSSPCPRQCPVRASSVPRVAVQLIGVQCPCGCLSVQVSSVRPQASGVASGVRAFSVRCVRPEWSWSVAVGQAVVRLGWPGSVVARRVHNGASSARGWTMALEAGTGRGGPAAGRLRLDRRHGYG
jgi:hypothetical protein